MSDPNSDALPLGYTPIIKSCRTKGLCFWYLLFGIILFLFFLQKKQKGCKCNIFGLRFNDREYPNFRKLGDQFNNVQTLKNRLQ